MSIWGDMIKRSTGLIIRKEDMNLFFLQKGTYTGVLTPETKTILSRINDFLCFPQFVPGDLLFDKGGVKVFLDDREERTFVVTPDELEDELKKTNEEIETLRDILENHGQPKNDDKSLSELYERLARLEDKVSEIERRLRDGDYVIKTELLGYYCRRI